MAQETRNMDIFLHLEGKGVKAYFPGQKEGECIEPYVVVKFNGETKLGQYSSTQAVYDLMCYVPKDQYTLLERYADQVQAYMKELHPMVKTLYSKTPSYYDDTLKAHMTSMQYTNHKKII